MDPEKRRNMVASAVVLGVSGTVALAYQKCNPDQSVEYFYLNKHKPLYCLLKLCTVVIFAAVAFNARFLISGVAELAMARLTTSLVR